MFVALMLLALSATAVAPTSPATDIAASGPDGLLKGTMQGLPGANVVLILPGSGPTDRDGNSPFGVKASTYRLLAEALATNGIASVRIDKRGLFASAGAVPDGNAVTLADYVQDTKAWISVIRQRTAAHCVWLLGHSEGGLVALATAVQDKADVCGLVLLATAGRPLAEVLKEQLHANPANAPLLPAADQAIAALSAGQRVDVAGLPAPLNRLFRPEVQGLLISELSVDPADLVGRLKKPILIVQGERDLQVSPEDARRLKTANSAAQLRLLPKANHVFKQVDGGTRQANFATYFDPNLPLVGEVVETISTFITENKKP